MFLWYLGIKYVKGALLVITSTLSNTVCCSSKWSQIKKQCLQKIGSPSVLLTESACALFNWIGVYNCIFFRYCKPLEKRKIRSLVWLNTRRIVFLWYDRFCSEFDASRFILITKHNLIIPYCFFYFHFWKNFCACPIVFFKTFLMKFKIRISQLTSNFFSSNET